MLDLGDSPALHAAHAQADLNAQLNSLGVHLWQRKADPQRVAAEDRRYHRAGLQIGTGLGLARLHHSGKGCPYPSVTQVQFCKRQSGFSLLHLCRTDLHLGGGCIDFLA